MPINPDAVGFEGKPVERSWTSKDALLYALGVGAGATDPTGFELDLTTENSDGVTQRVLPTFPVIVGVGGDAHRSIGTYDPAMLVHGEQAVELHGRIPVAGRILVTDRVTGVYDKGSAAVVTMEADSVDAATGDKLFTTRSAMFIRGEGGFGGDRGPSGGGNQAPDREPDHVVTYSTRTDQALLYRLSGDRNPLHSDPAFAARAGFPKPILHGLCTYGFTGRALLHTLCGSDPARFRSMEGRFSRPVFPGDELVVRMWVDGEGSAVFRTENGAGDVVLDQGRVGFQP
ncbi:MAG TPA: MaoC/PaaZ C-terminal domain-containing protein [Acidimicrobiales bacterium]|nr:MaoC/PaaZ C-terminal domain-containing protein [Acidimicrobiales bacterium]